MRANSVKLILRAERARLNKFIRLPGHYLENGAARLAV
jgi:hypothetical protein